MRLLIQILFIIFLGLTSYNNFGCNIDSQEDYSIPFSLIVEVEEEANSLNQILNKEIIYTENNFSNFTTIISKKQKFTFWLDCIVKFIESVILAPPEFI